MKRTAWGGLLAALALAVCLSLLPTTARADETHSHAVCGTTCPDEANHGGHGEAVDFQAMYYDTATKELVCGENRRKNYNDTFGYKIKSGKYYLSSNITLDALIYIDAVEDVTICLNGHSITVNADESAIAIAGRGKLTLCDCQGGGTITHGTDPDSGKKYIGCGVLVNGGGTFTMYGGCITGNRLEITESQKEKSGAGVSVSSGGAFAMYGGSVTGNTVSSGNTGAGIYTSSGATIGGNAEISGNEATNGKGAGIYCGGGSLSIQGNAKITGNKASGGEGAGIYCGGSLSIQGKAEISGNEASGGKGGGVYMSRSYTEQTIGGKAKIMNNTAADGGGVYMTNYGGTLVLRDSAAITRNTAITAGTSDMGGISIAFGALQVSGSVQVTGNVRKASGNSEDSKASNAYVGNDSITVADALTADALIGMTVYENVLNSVMSGTPKPVAEATAAGWIREGSFTHDGGTGNGLYGIRVNDEGTQAELRHDHVWEITTSEVGHMFSEKCSSCDELGGSVTLTEPAPNVGEKMVYDGSTVWRPTVTTTGTLHTSVTYSGTYRCVWMDGDRETALDWNDDAAWRNAGHYTVIMEGGGKTDKIQYPVDRRDPAADDFVFTPPALETLEYDGLNKSAAVRWRDGVDGGAIESVYYQKQDDTYVADSNGPVDAGAYRVKISTGFSRNITPLSFFGDTAWTFTIRPAEYDYEMPATANLVEGSEVKMLPKGTGIGVNGKAVEGTLEWYTYDVQSNLVEVKQGNLDEVSYVGNSFTLYWKFTATDPNYTTAPQNGEVAFTVVKPPKQDLRITTSVSSKDHVAELKKEYGYPEFFLDVQNSPDGGDITYFEFDNEVAKVEKTSGGGLMVTINGAGTTEIKVTAAAVRGKYEATTATCTLKVLPREVIFGAQVKDKIYDGTTDAEVEFTLDRVLPSDEVYVIAADTKFTTPDVGKNRMVQISNVTLGGANARGYVVSKASPEWKTAEIIAKEIRLADVERVDKVYDGSADYTVRGEVFEGLVGGDTLTRGVDYDISGYFPDADADETNQTVNVSVVYKNNENTKNYVLSPDGGKYTFPGWARILKQPHANAAASLDAYYGGSGAADLSGLLVERGTAAVYAIEGDTAILTAYSLGADTVLHAAVVNDRAKIGASATVRVLVTSVNYADYFIDVTVTVSDKENVTISGLTYADKTYDRQAIAPAGTLTVSGDKVPTGELEVRYTGTGGTVYDSTTAPTAAGSYQVTYRVPEGNADYTGSVTYAFAIRKKVVTVKPKNVTITAGEALPAFELEYDGLVGGDTLTAVPAPQFTVYAIDSDTEVLTPTAGSYRICWTNAGAFSGAENYEVFPISVGALTVTSAPAPTPGGSSGGSTAAKTETTTNPDGSTTKTETKPDGTVIETTTGKDGSTTRTETKPDGSSVTEAKTANGSTGTVKTDKNGKIEAEARISGKAVEDAKKSGEAVKVPTEVKAGENSDSAPTVKVELPKDAGKTRIEIPVEDVNSGTVAVIVREDGTEEIVKGSKPTEDGIELAIDGSAAIRIIDNSKDFIDTRNHWSRNEVNFVASREIFNGVGNDLFGVGQPMTRGMVNTVLARLVGVDTTPKNGQKWYEVGTAWAKANGISDGTNPEASVTREQLATLLYRFSGAPEVKGSLQFNDAHEVSDYAENALIWATQNGIVNGVGNDHIAPRADAQRAQVAAMMARYLKNMG